jgi:hypothetical protein
MLCTSYAPLGTVWFTVKRRTPRRTMNTGMMPWRSMPFLLRLLMM